MTEHNAVKDIKRKDGIKWPDLVEEYLYGNCEQSAKAIEVLDALETQAVPKDARIAELEAAVESRQTRIGEFEKQVQEAMALTNTIWDLKISKRWQARILKRTYENFMYSRTAQALRQMKLEVLSQSAEKMALQKHLDSSIELNGQMLAQLDDDIKTLQEFQDERNKLIAQWEETQAEVLSLKSKYGEP
jgi:chromosome segregation ATPase